MAMEFVEYIFSLPPFILIIYFFVTGSIFGSFANVVIHRTLRMIQEEEEREKRYVISEKPKVQHVNVWTPASAGVTVDEGVGNDEKEAKNEDRLKEAPPDSVLESGSDHITVNQQTPPTDSTDSEISPEADSQSQDFPPISLKERFTDRIMQHVEFFYCLFIFCVKKPIRFVWRWILSALRFFRKGKKQKKDRLSFSQANLLKWWRLVFRVKTREQNSAPLNPKERDGLERDEINNPPSTEKEESFPLDLMGHSRCPHCNYKIPFYLNIPILSWFFLRGCCRNCQAGIPFRYPLVEFLMACLFTGLFVLMGWKWFLLEALIFVFGLVVVSFIDWERMILPSFFTLPGIYLGLIGGFLNPERAFSSALIGWLVGGFILWLSGYLYFKIRNQEGMGDGDVSLMGWIGAVLGWKSISFVLIISCFFGVVFGIWGILRDRKDARTPFPFGPCLAAGAVCYIFIQFFASDILRVFSPF